MSTRASHYTSANAYKYAHTADRAGFRTVQTSTWIRVCLEGTLVGSQSVIRTTNMCHGMVWSDDTRPTSGGAEGKKKQIFQLGEWGSDTYWQVPASSVVEYQEIRIVVKRSGVFVPCAADLCIPAAVGPPITWGWLSAYVRMYVWALISMAIVDGGELARGALDLRSVYKKDSRGVVSASYERELKAFRTPR